MKKYNIGDIVKDIKTNRIAKIIKIYQSKENSNQFYYFIVFKNTNIGAYRSYKFLIPLNI